MPTVADNDDVLRLLSSTGSIADRYDPTSSGPNLNADLYDATTCFGCFVKVGVEIVPTSIKLMWTSSIDFHIGLIDVLARDCPNMKLMLTSMTSTSA